MKFCYVDESGTGSEPYAVMVGIVIDAYRMRPTKDAWSDLLTTLTSILGTDVDELHTKDFYPGNGIWRGVDGPKRSRIIDAITNWLSARNHKIVYSAIDKASYNQGHKKTLTDNNIGSIWQTMAMHICLAIQKEFQGHEKNKGNTLLIFDNKDDEAHNIRSIIKNPPQWTDTFYSRGKKQQQLDQIIDVPYFCDSKDVGMIQVADFAAYFLRLHLELQNGTRQEKFTGEKDKIADWVQRLLQQSITSSSIYPKRNRCACASVFWDCAPTQVK